MSSYKSDHLYFHSELPRCIRTCLNVAPDEADPGALSNNGPMDNWLLDTIEEVSALRPNLDSVAGCESSKLKSIIREVQLRTGNSPGPEVGELFRCTEL